MQLYLYLKTEFGFWEREKASPREVAESVRGGATSKLRMSSKGASKKREGKKAL